MEATSTGIERTLESLAQRQEILHVNIESLHASVSELLAGISKHTEQLRIDAENIRALARIAENPRAPPVGPRKRPAAISIHALGRIVGQPR